MNMCIVMYFPVKCWMKAKIETSSIVIEDAPICSWKSIETLGEDVVSST